MPFVEGLRLDDVEFEKATSEMSEEKANLGKSESELAEEEFLSETLHPKVSEDPVSQENIKASEGVVTAADKLASIFKSRSKEDFVYDETEKGEVILGYEDVIVNGVPTRRAIVQEKVNMSIDDLDMRIEPPVKRQGENDNPYGLIGDELKRYRKLKALSKGFGTPLTEEQIVAKAKDISDLDATMIPDMMIHFVTEKEDEYLDISQEEKNAIKELRTQGIMMEPETILGIHKSLELAAADKSIQMVNMLKFLSHKNADINKISTDEAAEVYGELYRKERRPGLPLVIKAEMSTIPEQMYEKIRQDSTMEKADREARILELKANPTLRRDLVKLYEEKTGEKFYQMKDFRKTITYFVQWGMYEEDAQYFDPNQMSAPKDGVPMRTLFEEFKKDTGYDYIDVYKFWWDKITEIKEKQEEAESKGLDPNQINQTIEMKSDIVSEDDKFDGIEWE
jgi:hypothetical protein